MKPFKCQAKLDHGENKIKNLLRLLAMAILNSVSICDHSDNFPEVYNLSPKAAPK